MDEVGGSEMLDYSIDECFVFRNVLFCRGWGLHETDDGMTVHVRWPDGNESAAEFEFLPSPDVEAMHGPRGARCRFDFHIPLPKPYGREELSRLAIVMANGDDRFTVVNPNGAERALEQIRECESTFWREVHSRAHGKALEIGSRARNGHVRRGRFPAGMDYVGLDIKAGPNVDVTGDAHKLSRLFEPETFDFAFSISTFEHLLMPWVVAAELNEVMKTGGLAYIQSHQTWPMHEMPWDYYRFTQHSWQGLFNRFTGFEIVRAAQGKPCVAVPLFHDAGPIYRMMEYLEGYMLSACLIRKTGPAMSKWSADPELVTDIHYSHE